MDPSKPVSVLEGKLSRQAQSILEVAPSSAAEVDHELVNQAVRDLNAIYMSRALETACVIGQYVIDRFFEGKAGTIAQFGRRHASFRALARHPELGFSSTYLWTAVAVVRQLSELPVDVGSRLPLSHHRLLLPLNDSSTKTALAEKALNCRLSKRELAREIALLRERRVLRRKKKMKRMAVLKAMSHLADASEDFVRVATSECTVVGETSQEGVGSLLARLELDLDAVRCTVEILRSRLQIRTAPTSSVPPGERVTRRVVGPEV